MRSVMLVLPEYPLGGAERQAHALAKSSLNKINKVFLLDATSTISSRDVDGVEVLGCDCEVLFLETKNRLIRRIKRYFAFYFLYKKLLVLGDSVFVFYNPIFLPLAFFLRCSGCKVVFSIRENSAYIFSVVNIFILKRMDYVYTNTPSVSKEMDRRGIECALFLNSISDGVSPLALPGDLCREKNSLLVISNLEPHKRIDLLLEATLDLELTIRVCGKISNASYYEKCLSLARKSKCKVEFLGLLPRENLVSYLRSSTLLVHPSNIEGTSNAILDALLFNTPVVVSDIAENAYLVDDFNVCMFRRDSAASLRSAIQNVLSYIDEDWYQAHVCFLSRRVKLKFSSENLSGILSKFASL